ncbi:hypothetical protein MRX96_029211 [Rhipicephalus microplus]
MAGCMTEAEDAATDLAYELIIVGAGLIVLLIFCWVCYMRDFIGAQRDMRPVVMQQGAHPDHFGQQLRPVANPGAVAARPPPFCPM